jgi:hypothetical protein
MKRLALAVLALAACGKAETRTSIDVSGVMTPIGRAAVSGTAFTLYGAQDLVSGSAPVMLGQGAVAADGSWSVAQVDVTAVSDAVIAVTAGTDALFPTLSGVVDYSSGGSKVSLDTGRLFVVPRAVATALTSAMGNPALLTRGFVMGLVTDGVAPIAGAKVKSASSLTLDVWYPSADLTTLSRVETSASGLFLVSADPALLFLELVAVKTGHSFATTLAPLKFGVCSFAVVLPSVPAAALSVDVSGLVTPIGASSAAGAVVQAIAPYDFATSAAPAALGSATVSQAGTFALAGVEVTNVSQGLLAKVSGDALFPTVSGITAWASEADADKKISGDAHLFAVSKVLAQTLAAGLNEPELLTAGFVMGLVTDGAAPVAGATLTRVDGKPLTVLYPNASFTSLSGTQTSANGLFFLLPDPALNLAPVLALKAGSSFAPGLLMLKPGVCFFVVLRP